MYIKGCNIFPKKNNCNNDVRAENHSTLEADYQIYKGAGILGFFPSLNIIDDVINKVLGTSTVSPVSISSPEYNNPISITLPLFPNTVILSSILNGLVIVKYIPAIRFPMTFWAAKPITMPVIAPIDAAKAGFSLRNDIIIAVIINEPRILMRLLIDLAVCLDCRAAVANLKAELLIISITK